MSNAPFPIQPELTAIAVMYKNKSMIADQVAPRVPVGKQEFKYLKHDLAEGFTVPDTKVGRKSKPNEVEFTATEETDSTEDFGLDDPIPQADINNAPPNYNPLGKSVEFTTNLIELDREVRVANKVFNAANYAAGNKITLSGTDQFSNAASSPIDVMTDALDSMIMRGNVMVVGRLAYSRLVRHPHIIKAYYGTGNDKGIANREILKELFELEDVLVGESFVNTARKGQAASLARAWGKHIALIHRAANAELMRGATFMLTAEFGSRIAGGAPDKDIGLRGGVRVRVGESVKEVMLANDLGYLIQNAVA
ncbi:MAG: hypothetical protein K9L79_01580 [Methylobacter tundripaludum]|nr:hypothetical protein [Methylobacter tundripaludum]